MEIWNKLKQPPKTALKEIKGGRLKGMTDVNPQWRYQAMTETFGICGIGWKYKIEKTWCEDGSDGVIFAFAEIALYIKQNGEWSEPIPGIGGSQLVLKESGGMYSSDEGYKMAVTDALSVAMKMLGVAADIYAGLWDGSKYNDTPTTKSSGQKSTGKSKQDAQITEKQWYRMKKQAEATGMTEQELVKVIKWKAEKEGIAYRHWKIGKLFIPEENFEAVLAEYNKKQEGPPLSDEPPPY